MWVFSIWLVSSEVIIWGMSKGVCARGNVRECMYVYCTTSGVARIFNWRRSKDTMEKELMVLFS